MRRSACLRRPCCAARECTRPRPSQRSRADDTDLPVERSSRWLHPLRTSPLLWPSPVSWPAPYLYSHSRSRTRSLLPLQRSLVSETTMQALSIVILSHQCSREPAHGQESLLEFRIYSRSPLRGYHDRSPARPCRSTPHRAGYCRSLEPPFSYRRLAHRPPGPVPLVHRVASNSMEVQTSRRGEWRRCHSCLSHTCPPRSPPPEPRRPGS
mmetsp:Transcript_7327/g.27858  ORF Transcript_7327/g.27858 Transcript_7327/m.27858 type:complete len:210 (+) Transcript_7327:995-1624(+)